MEGNKEVERRKQTKRERMKKKTCCKLRKGLEGRGTYKRIRE